jgi:hypothetical protein
MTCGVDTREILRVVVYDRGAAYSLCTDGTGWCARSFRRDTSPWRIPVVWYDDPRRRALGGLCRAGHESDSIIGRSRVVTDGLPQVQRVYDGRASLHADESTTLCPVLELWILD